MAETVKKYPYSASLLYNLACDIVEMYKAEVTEDSVERFRFTTVMYEQKTGYLFKIEKQEDGCLLAIETDGEGEQAERQVAFMFAIVDDMLAQLKI